MNLSVSIVTHIQKCVTHIHTENKANSVNKICKIIGRQSLSDRYVQTTHRKSTAKKKNVVIETLKGQCKDISSDDEDHKELYATVFANVYNIHSNTNSIDTSSWFS